MGVTLITNNFIIFNLLLYFGVGAFGSPHHDDLLPHEQRLIFHEHHLYHLRNLLLGIFGTIAVFAGSFLLYRYLTATLGGGGRDMVFSERGALLPTSIQAYPQIFTTTPRFSMMWPFRAFHSQQGVAFPATPLQETTVNYNASPDKQKNYYDPWERL